MAAVQARARCVVRAASSLLTGSLRINSSSVRLSTTAVRIDESGAARTDVARAVVPPLWTRRAYSSPTAALIGARVSGAGSGVSSSAAPTSGYASTSNNSAADFVNYAARGARQLTSQLFAFAVHFQSSRRSSDGENAGGGKGKEKGKGKGKGDGGGGGGPNPSQQVMFWVYSIGLTALLLMMFGDNERGGGGGGMASKKITWQAFLSDYLGKGLVKRLEVVDSGKMVLVYTTASGERDGAKFPIGSIATFEEKLAEALRLLDIDENAVPVTYTQPSQVWHELGRWLPTFVIIGFTLFMISRSSAMMRNKTGGMFSFGANKAKKFNKETAPSVTFDDVAGLPEAKMEIMEFVEFLKNPKKYTDLGAKIPKGALLVGPPGTGKTLLAKATAGEASVPFFFTSGSDFIEMFVGVGPSRVRELFAEARKETPCIIFIDEIDAIGRARGRSGFQGGNDERENTLNQLLVEMDGFTTNEEIVVLAGTNRPDILDKALLRPGRFDRQVSVDLPDLKSRVEVFRVHLKKIAFAGKIDPIAERMAALTPGFAGADIANVCNEGALMAARRDGDSVTLEDFEKAIEKVIGGLEKKNRVLSASERKIVAYHEAGHAVTAWLLENCDPLLKVSIIPRGTAALGYAQYVPQDQYLYTQEQLLDRMCMTLGGRVAESLFFDSVTTGASDDLDKVTKLAYSQVNTYGFSKAVGPLNVRKKDGQMHRLYSEATAALIDAEVRTLVAGAFTRTEQLLEANRAKLAKVAELLLKKETLVPEDIEAILGARPEKTFSPAKQFWKGYDAEAYNLHHSTT